MALSNELSAFNIDAILASTADRTPHKVVLVKQFVNHKRGLKAYADRYERVHGKELLQTCIYIYVIRGMCDVDESLLPGCIHFKPVACILMEVGKPIYFANAWRMLPMTIA